MRFPESVRNIISAWTLSREYAAKHRGLLVAAPVFWASFIAFIHPAWGAAGFALHAALCLPRRPLHALMLIAACPLLALWLSARTPCLTLPQLPFHRDFIADATPIPRTGIVAGIPVPGPLGFTFLFRETAEPRNTYRVTVEGQPPPWGATLALTGTARQGSPAPNPGQLDMQRVLRGQGAVAVLEASDWRMVHPPPMWKRALMRTRDALGSSLARHVPPPALPLLEAALLNRTENVPEETRTAFARSGMQHVLAISGQHIGLIAGFVLLLAACARLPRKVAWTAAALLGAVYVPLVGSPVSAARSGLALACILPAILRERQPAALHALCLTAALDLLLDPHNILNLGFQLSYAATLALILGARPTLRAAGLMTGGKAPGDWPGATAIRAILQTVLLSATISLFTLPVLAASTHAVAPWGILGNVAAVPAGAGMLVCGLITWCLDFLLPAPLNMAASWAGAAAGACALALESVVSFLAGLPGALRPVPDAGAAWVAAFASGCAAVAALARSGRLRAAGLCALLLVAAEALRPSLLRPRPGAARVTFLAVGHGDAAVMELPGAVILIDAGDSPRVARRIIAPFLLHRGIARIDLLMITHPDRDHYGGAATLLESVPIGAILGPAVAAESTATWRCLAATARARGVAWREGRAGDRVYEAPEISLRLLSPGPVLDGADKNDRSLVALLDTRRARVLFTGDIEQPGQQALATTWPLWRGAWLKAPHHGSDRTTAPCFPRAAAAPRTVISCGGRRGFPGLRTLEALASTGSITAVTARHGAVTWEFAADLPGGARETRHLTQTRPN